MFLKTLSIKGFKSFADATSLQMEPGVTVVVGPNGSGKSNVVDAIGWVLGAQAPSAVRSQKMDDVIFAGTTKRPALGRAEVGLTIDNSSGMLPIEFNEVTITRTLFRSGDSEYAINGVPCRLLDIQELLSDTGVGRQQHVIISQGQIDAVLNARPEERRLIIEEAAGVLKYRRRKEKAERRLASTEGNLTRVQDLLREVRRQLRPLEKQAEAARRHGAVVAELTALRLHLAGQDIARLQGRVESAARLRTELQARERDVRTALAELDTRVLTTETELTAMGGHDLGDTLGRFESLREKALGLAALTTERRRGVERERDATVDRAVIATLEAEAARLADVLAAAEREAAELEPASLELAEAAADLAAAREAFQADWADGVALPSGRAAEVRGELAALRAAVERGRGEAERVGERLDTLQQKAERLGAEADRLRAELADAEQRAPGLAARRAGAEQERAEAAAAALAADEARRVADGEHHSWSARADALASALDAARAEAGVERLAGIDGIVGTLLDVVSVDPGWEAAFEAAAGEAIAAVVVADVASARTALSHLRDHDLSGAVLALGAAPASGRSPATRSVRQHVRSDRPDVSGLLDVLVGPVAVADSWVEAVDVALAEPGRVVVTRSGDRLGPMGWRVGMAGSGATRAALDEARVRAAQAAEAAQAAAQVARAARAAHDAAQQAEREAARAVEQGESRQRAASDAARRVEADRADSEAEAESLRQHATELAQRVVTDEARVADLARLLPELEAEETELADRARAMNEARSQLEERAGAVGAQRSDLEVRSAGLDDRRQFLQRRLGEVEERLARDVAERQAAEGRRVELDRKAVALDRLAGFVAARLELVEAEVATLREQRRLQTDAARQVALVLEELRKERTAAEADLESVRERLRRCELDDTEVRLRLEQAVETLRHDLDCEPAAALAAPLPELPEGVAPAARVRELDRDLRLMGPINPLALEEFEAMRERNEFLEAQLEDVRNSRRELAKVIRAVDGEIVATFAAAYADVEDNFRKLFDMLFPGGKGELRLTDPDNLLDTGIEVEARPSGKNVRKLSLLSGGERSLTALAYLFAVFRSRPSPFYVMDEVEAALDDVNLHRFLDLVHEFRADAQLIIVSHQKRTMEAADCLYGVTMQPGGSSRVISEKVTAD
jgi:chromosome segregation protein